jgi:hypothetical protein
LVEYSRYAPNWIENRGAPDGVIASTNGLGGLVSEPLIGQGALRGNDINHYR